MMDKLRDNSERSSELLRMLIFDAIEYDEDIGDIFLPLQEKNSKYNSRGLLIFGVNMNSYGDSRINMTLEQQRDAQNLMKKLKQIDEHILSLDSDRIISFKIENHNSGSGYDTPYRLAAERIEKIMLKVKIKQKKEDSIWKDISRDGITDDEKIEIIDAIMKVLKSIEEKGIGEDVETLVDDTETATDRLLKKFRQDHGII